ncbi:TatD family hydrolase [uncultured Pseudokineococcus sp.]|uniref:TatD family hydrolase n=1 Tax=uncultured Pseudokineococcus sp. TaxID=1642928 RepID=UPI0026281527|nr:TatD family hydrolase [uncultured Pseudokineococcus sp.]
MAEEPARPRARSSTGADGRRRDRSWPPAPEPLPVPVVDDHTHLDIVDGPGADERSDDGDRRTVEDLLALAAAAGVPRAVQIGCDLPAARWTVEAVQRHPELVGGVALHPNEAPVLAARGELDDALEEIGRLARADRIRVVGETGMDAFRTDAGDAAAVAAQEESFRAHVRLAEELGLPVQVHDRDAHADVLRVLAEERAERVVLHCFSGDVDMARECVARGYWLSFAGTVTFSNAGGLRSALSVVPLERVLLETDAPFLTPSPHRGRPNASYLVPHTARVVAGVLDVPLEELCTAVAATAEELYGPW